MAKKNVQNLEVVVSVKDSVFDPYKLEATQKIERLNTGTVVMKAGVYFRIEIPNDSHDDAVNIANALCVKLLANPEYQQYQILNGNKVQGRFLIAEQAKKESIHDIEALITLKSTINNPEAQNITGALHHLGFDVNIASTGKYYQLQVPGDSQQEALLVTKDLMGKGLARPALEIYQLLPPITDPLKY